MDCNVKLSLEQLSVVIDILCRAYIFDDFLDESERVKLRCIIDNLCAVERVAKYGI